MPSTLQGDEVEENFRRDSHVEGVGYLLSLLGKKTELLTIYMFLCVRTRCNETGVD